MADSRVLPAFVCRRAGKSGVTRFPAIGSSFARPRRNAGTGAGVRSCAATRTSAREKGRSPKSAPAWSTCTPCSNCNPASPGCADAGLLRAPISHATAAHMNLHSASTRDRAASLLSACTCSWGLRADHRHTTKLSAWQLRLEAVPSSVHSACPQRIGFSGLDGEWLWISCLWSPQTHPPAAAAALPAHGSAPRGSLLQTHHRRVDSPQ